jgi:hypothetical protein
MADEQTIRGLRGYYTWGGGDDIPAPTNQRAKLRYKRFTMRDLWPEKDRFDWSSLDGELDRAVRNGQLYALRLRDMPGDGVGVPDWVVQAGLTVNSMTIDTNKPITLPKYGPDYLAILRQFVQAVAQHCQQRNPGLLAIVDIGMLGRWGEGHFWGIKGQNGKDGTAFWMPSVETQRAIVDAHIDAFGGFAWLVSMTEPEDMLKYALFEAKAPRPIGWRRDSLGNKRFDEVKDAFATTMKERAKTAPVITEFFGGTGGGTDVALARKQAKAWGVWLVSNGNLGREWKDLNQAEQAELLGMAGELCPAPSTNDPRPTPDTKPPAVDGQKLAEALAQIQALQSKVDALTALLQASNLAALQSKVDALTALLQAVDVPGLHSKVNGLATSLETRTAALATSLETRTAALTALVQQERRFVVETTIREVAESEPVIR